MGSATLLGKIVAKLDKEIDALEGVRLLRQEAEKRIDALLLRYVKMNKISLANKFTV